MSPYLPPLARRLLLAAAVLAATVAVRLTPRADVLPGGAVQLTDLDTMRRLVRLEGIDRASDYPPVEIRDGWPDGTTLHWTLPMDHVIRVLDPAIGWLVPGERGYEGGAVLAGPVLAAAAVAAFVALARRLLGEWPALVAGLLYALGHSFVATSLLGNGDHQTLQQLAAVVAVLGLSLALQRAGDDPGGARPRALPWGGIAGGALGFAIWVSTELMLLFYVGVVALAALQAVPARSDAQRSAVRRVTAQWSGGVLALALLGHLAEHRGRFAVLHWDVVSLFQVWQIAVFALFASGVCRLGRRPGRAPVAVAGAGALAVGLLPLLSPAVRHTLAAQLADATEVNVWLKTEVSEFRSLFAYGFGALTDREGWLPFLMPFALVGLRWSPLGGPAAVVLGITAAGTFALYLWEVKLGHLHALTYPLLLAAAWLGIARRLGFQQRRWPHAVAAALAAWSALAHLPGRRAPTLRANDQIVREICAKVAQLHQGGEAGVLAPWDMGAPLLHRTRAGVVATGYHRNLEGIRDGFRFWLTDASQRERAMEILRRRRVRWVVAWHDRLFFDGGARTIGMAPLRTASGLLPAARQTMFWKLRYDSVPGFKLVAEGPQIQKGRDAPEPVYRLFEVRP